MGIATFPASSGGLTSAVRSIQRGVAASSGNITISTVDTTKTICNSFSTSSAGSVAATGAISAANGTGSGVSTSAASGNSSITIGAGAASGRPGANYTSNPRYGANQFAGYSVGASNNLNAMNINAHNIGLNATNISGGSTSLTTAVYGIYLVNSTTINASGPCRYEVIEYY